MLQKSNLTHFGTFWLVLASSKRLWNIQSDPKCKKGIFHFHINDSRWDLCHFFHCITCLTHIGTFWLFLTTFRGPIKLQWLLTRSVSIHHFLVSWTYPKNQLSKVKIGLLPLHNLFDLYRHFLTVLGYFQRAYKAPMTSNPLYEYSSFSISCTYSKNQLSKVKIGLLPLHNLFDPYRHFLTVLGYF